MKQAGPQQEGIARLRAIDGGFARLGRETIDVMREIQSRVQTMTRALALKGHAAALGALADAIEREHGPEVAALRAFAVRLESYAANVERRA